jgi:hypothetical protein
MNIIIAAILAQTNIPPVVPDPLHTSQTELWKYAIAVVTPLAISLVKWGVPKVPKLLLPSLAPFVGIALGFALNAVGMAHVTWVDGALLGGFGVAIREVLDQAVKLQQSQGSKAGISGD